MAEPLKLYSAKGSGSVAVEAALTLLGRPYVIVAEAPTWTQAGREAVRPVNAMEQLPVLITPQGEVMTESAAILIWLGDLHPQAGLAPPPDHPDRGAYLRWMVFVPAAIYAMYYLLDDPARMVDGEAAQHELRERALERIKFCWKVMEAQVEPAPFVFGPQLSLLDVYLTVVSRWNPRRRWFEEACPKLASVARRVDALPELQALWAERMPFEPGWEG
ncbi:glutathione S-transferase family protein [Caulobacter sp. 17J80-11]|uniref:glutathione S-transferase family protein n=1 Tax=Caulobacter sp. 17J80-11 TaxID=2763502 RepID=UPI001653DF65|nr:glutathione S-transferase family protein [Caulobacter sp. 17J80-11]MBC6981632.1 glutathione S-transferase family protein [Caulobacter sp. 17J80-11]